MIPVAKPILSGEELEEIRAVVTKCEGYGVTVVGESCEKHIINCT